MAILHNRISNSTAVKRIRRFLDLVYGISFIVETWPRIFITDLIYLLNHFSQNISKALFVENASRASKIMPANGACFSFQTPRPFFENLQKFYGKLPTYW